jgi:hypothetical protein
MIQTLHRGPISFVGSELDGQSEQSAAPSGRSRPVFTWVKTRNPRGDAILNGSGIIQTVEALNVDFCTAVLFPHPTR